jgi:hypothetical protein
MADLRRAAMMQGEGLHLDHASIVHQCTTAADWIARIYEHRSGVQASASA